MVNNDFFEAFSKFGESLEIRRNLSVEAPKKFLPEVAFSLAHLAYLNFKTNRFYEALELSKEILEIYKDLSGDNSMLFLKNIIEANCDVSLFSIYTKEFRQAEHYARQALEIDNNYVIAKRHLANSLLFQNLISEAETIFKDILLTAFEVSKKGILEDFDLFDKANVIPEECKKNVEKIKTMLLE